MDKMFLCCLVVCLYACSPAPADNHATNDETVAPITDSAAWVVGNAIARHGGSIVDSSLVSFTFRERHYVAERGGGQFTYKRSYTNDEGQVIADSMTNEIFVRYVDQEEAELSEKQVSSYSNSLNSVMYFAFLPYFLQDQAVHLAYHGIGMINEKPHYKVLVTFSQEGGGKDFEDEYVYWFAKEDFELNYLAYNFLVNGGGARFREAYNPRSIDGILFQDYINYKPTEDRRDVLAFDSLFQTGALDTLSRIELEEITVE